MQSSQALSIAQSLDVIKKIDNCLSQLDEIDKIKNEYTSQFDEIEILARENVSLRWSYLPDKYLTDDFYSYQSPRLIKLYSVYTTQFNRNELMRIKKLALNGDQILLPEKESNIINTNYYISPRHIRDNCEACLTSNKRELDKYIEKTQEILNRRNRVTQSSETIKPEPVVSPVEDKPSLPLVVTASLLFIAFMIIFFLVEMSK